MRIAVVQGTRPEIVKNYSVVKALRNEGVPFRVLHTNQHVAQSMCSVMYEDMAYQPDFHLPGTYRLGAAIDWLQDTFRENRITHVVVNGDTAAALAGAVAALYSDISLTHIEAGLRSGDRYMLEERNRIMVDSVADLLVAYTAYEAKALRSSKSVRGQVFVEGNTTADVLEDFASRLVPPTIIEGPYLFATMHRREFTECPNRMREVFSSFARIAESLCPLILPMHLRTRDAMQRHGIPWDILGQVTVLEPLPIFDSLSLQKHAAAVLTDSGCIQEEAYMLGVPCVTIRENTERHLTVQHGANALSGFRGDDIVSAVQAALALRSRDWPPIYGGPGAGQRILERILREFG
ncbi:non-hydrolyzing UDP-N-acetylglucosamine 2-epimerase [Methyloterricola oryzae]|uniref:non-hydrolyzing UDP-N-acetylglucosamine 2-epimerase n=1 Tax=Methyloterricola oryzae TaxID=1495050 RepID=UPI0005EAE666|nr:UDP-N-acetylglucosamine 2-epimerase (non-hydrolyzing) [Methyloterricola oryzae]